MKGPSGRTESDSRIFNRPKGRFFDALHPFDLHEIKNGYSKEKECVAELAQKCMEKRKMLTFIGYARIIEGSETGG